MTIKSELDKLAIQLLRTASNDSDDSKDIEQKIDVFKAVSAYHLGTQRVTKGKPADEGDKTSFKDILARVGVQTAPAEQNEPSAKKRFPGH